MKNLPRVVSSYRQLKIATYNNSKKFWLSYSQLLLDSDRVGGASITQVMLMRVLSFQTNVLVFFL